MGEGVHQCPDCGEEFSRLVWHCRECGRHWPLKRATCYSCGAGREEKEMSEVLSVFDAALEFEEEGWQPDPSRPYQVFPSLPPDIFEALKESIRQHGVSQPVEVDEEGDILDGHNRFDICQELQIPCPVKVISHLKTPQEKRDYARSLNCSRREVTLEMKKAQARQMLLEDHLRFDREIATCVGLSHPTVARIREELGGKYFHNQSDATEPEEQEEGPDLSFLDKPAWKSYHRLEALEHLQALGDEEKQILCELLNERDREPKAALGMLEAAAAFSTEDREKLRVAWANSEKVKIICRLAGTQPAPDARLSPAIETLHSLKRIPESENSDTAAMIRQAEDLLQRYVATIRDQQKGW